MNDGPELAELTAGVVGLRSDAWDRLYALTHLPLLRQLRRALSNDAQAEDALQNTYVTAVERIEQFDARRGSLDAWLAGIARNKARELSRQSRLTVFDPDAVEGIEVPVADDPDAELVALALDRLEARYAEVLRRKYLAGESLEAIGESLGLKQATVGTLLHRGRQRFREAYERLLARSDAP